jgi:hypothetical protein
MFNEREILGKILNQSLILLEHQVRQESFIKLFPGLTGLAANFSC